jgi:ent-kaurene oxidase
MESVVAALPAGGAAVAAAVGGLVAAAALAGKAGLAGPKKHLNAPPGQSPDMIPAELSRLVRSLSS